MEMMLFEKFLDFAVFVIESGPNLKPGRFCDFGRWLHKLFNFHTPAGDQAPNYYGVETQVIKLKRFQAISRERNKNPRKGAINGSQSVRLADGDNTAYDGSICRGVEKKSAKIAAG